MTTRLTIIVLLVALGALAGCGFTPEGTAARELTKTAGAQAYDEGLANAEWFICQAASAGAVQRRYGAAPELSAAWRIMCLGGGRPVFSGD